MEFEVLRRLGEGGQATVYLVREKRPDESDSESSSPRPARSVGDSQAAAGDVNDNDDDDQDSICCLKKIPCDSLLELNVALKEIQACLRLSHPNIVRTRHFCISPRSPPPSFSPSTPSSPSPSPSSSFYLEIFTDFCNAGSLKDLIDRSRRRGRVVDLSQILWFLEQLGEALVYLRQKRVLHRDIKPANLFLHHPKQTTGKATMAKFRLLRVGDFGFAKTLVRADESQATTTLGTPFFLAPEIKLCRGSYNWRVDMWGLSCVLLDLLLPKTVDFALEVGVQGLSGIKDSVAERYGEEVVNAWLGAFLESVVKAEVGERMTPRELVREVQRIRKAHFVSDEEEEGEGENDMLSSSSSIFMLSRDELEERVRVLEKEVRRQEKGEKSQKMLISSSTFGIIPPPRLKWSSSRKHRDVFVSDNGFACTKFGGKPRGNRNCAMSVEWSEVGRVYTVAIKYLNPGAAFHNSMIGLVDPYSMVMVNEISEEEVDSPTAATSPGLKGRRFDDFASSSSASASTATTPSSSSGSSSGSVSDVRFSRTTKSIGGSMPYSWGLYLRDGTVYHDRASKPYLSTPIASGDVIEMVVDLRISEGGGRISCGGRSGGGGGGGVGGRREASLSYRVNGKDCGVAFEGMNGHAYCPAVTLYSGTELFVVLD